MIGITPSEPDSTNHDLQNREVQRRTIVDIAYYRAINQADQIAQTHLVDGEDKERSWTHRELWEAASRVAEHLKSANAKGERVILLFDVGLDYIAAFFGIMAAGAIAVPAYPPVRPKMGERLTGIIEDCAPRFVLTTRPFLKMFQSQVPDAASLNWVATDELPKAVQPLSVPHASMPEDVAMLQYTSGTTGRPKGVTLTHGNLMANCEAGHQLLGPAPHRRKMFSWLPPFHDLGLIGGIMQPLYSGFPLVFMSPLHFIQRPARWLKAMSKHRATISGGPNFAFHMCARLKDDEIEGLDLSHWTEAICAAEPIRPATLELFCERFAPHGFAASSLIPCYGLAESTLLVSGKRAGELPRSRSFDRAELQRGGATLLDEANGGLRLTSTGRIVNGHDVRIVDPGTHQALPADRVGEIWVTGPSIAKGYWARPDDTKRIFGCQLPGDPRTYLNTGDLGFVSANELFITGRSKDLIIISGRNHYPEDIELTVEGAHSAVRRGGCVVFGVESELDELAIVVAELKRNADTHDNAAIVSNITERMTAIHGIAPAEVILCKRGTIERTTSGKVRRAASRQRYLAGQLRSEAAAV